MRFASIVPTTTAKSAARPPATSSRGNSPAHAEVTSVAGTVTTRLTPEAGRSSSAGSEPSRSVAVNMNRSRPRSLIRVAW